MPSDDLQADRDATDIGRSSGIRPAPVSFAQALPPSLRRLFGAAEPDGLFPSELAFLVDQGITPRLLEPAARAAAVAGVTGEAALFGLGLSDDLYYRLLARHLGALYLEEPMALSVDTGIAAAASVGVATLAPNRLGLRQVHAPRGHQIRLLLRQDRATDRRGTSLAITTPRRLDAMLRRHEGARSLKRAEDGLAEWDASLSARGGPARWQVGAGLILAIVMGFGLGANPERALLAVSVGLFPLFAAAVVQRLLVVRASRAVATAAPDRTPDHDLPVYTLLVPLFREARVLPQLVRALDALDYPALCRKRNKHHPLMPHNAIIYDGACPRLIVVTQLLLKKAAVEAQVVSLTERLAEAKADLFHVSAAVRLFDPSIIDRPATVYHGVAKAMRRSDLFDVCRAALEASPEPLDTRQLARAVITAEGWDTDDHRLRLAMAHKIGSHASPASSVAGSCAKAGSRQRATLWRMRAG